MIETYEDLATIYQNGEKGAILLSADVFSQLSELEKKMLLSLCGTNPNDENAHIDALNNVALKLEIIRIAAYPDADKYGY